MGGGGKGKTESSDDLNQIANQFFGETTPLRQTLNAQFLEALNTGGSEARMPIIAKSEERSRQATSNTLRALDSQLAQGGLAGSPFGERIRGETVQRGEQATARVPTDIVMQMLQAIPGYITGSNQTVVSGLGQAAGAEASSQGAAGGFLGAMLSPFSFNFGS